VTDPEPPGPSTGRPEGPTPPTGPPEPQGAPVAPATSPPLGSPASPAAVAVAPFRVPWRLLVSALVVCLAVGVLGGVAGSLATEAARQRLLDRSVTLPPVPAASGRSELTGVAAVAHTVLPGVVAIQVRGADGTGTGSGFVIDGRGYILTNNHVATASGGGDIQVVFQNGRHAAARLVGADSAYDLAVIKVEAGALPALTLSNSDDVVVGDPVVAIGSPLGLNGTVTTGIVSALNRPVASGEVNAPAFINAIQTDAAINPGNSGGPLVDAAGRVIGVTSAIARRPGTTDVDAANIGVGFAIPSNQASRTAQELIRTGKSRHPVVGVVLDRNYQGEGVKVVRTPPPGQEAVTPGGPADKAGIKPGDVIVAFNGRPVTDPDELIVSIRAQTPGDTVRLTVRRAGAELQLRLILDAATG
jgi:putative serine protease PepD